MIQVELGGFSALVATDCHADVEQAYHQGVVDEKRRCAAIAAEVRNRHGGLAYDVAAMIECEILAGKTV